MTVKPDAAAGGFDTLVGELETLAKAIPAADAPLTPEDEAAAEAAAAEAEAEANAAAAAQAAIDAGTAGAGTEEPFGKSFTFRLPDGTEAEGYDGTEMLKSIHQAQVALGGRADQMGQALAGVGQVVKGLMETVASQATLIKSMRADLARIGNQPAGRKSVAALPAPAADTAPKGVAYPDAMTMAKSLQESGKISGQDVARVVAYAHRGLGLPDDLAHHFLGA